MHIMKAENDPRKAIMEPNSGTKIETPTDRNVKNIRWATPNIRFSPIWEPCGDTERPDGFPDKCSGAARGTSSPRRISIVAFSWLKMSVK